MNFVFYMAPMPRRGRKSSVSPSKIRPKKSAGKALKKSTSIVLRKSSAKTMKKPSFLSFFDGSTAKSARIFIGTAAGAVASEVSTYAASEMLKKMQNSTVRVGGLNVRIVDFLNSGGKTSKQQMISTEGTSSLPNISPGGLGFGQSRRKTQYSVVFGDARKMPKSPIQPVTVRMYSSTFVSEFGEPSKAPSAGYISSSIGERTSRLFSYGIALPELQKRRIIARTDIQDAPVSGIETHFDPLASASVAEQRRYFPYMLDLQRKFTNLNQYLDAKVTISFVQFDSDEFTTESNYRVSSPLTTFAQLYTSGVPDTMKTPLPAMQIPKLYNILYNQQHEILGDQKLGSNHPRGAIQVSTRSGYGIRNSLISDQMKQVGARRTFILRPGEVLECNVKRYINENVTQNGFADSYSLNVAPESSEGGPLFAQNSIFMLVEVEGQDGEFYKVITTTVPTTPPTYPRYRNYYRSSLTAYVAVDETMDITMYNKEQGSPAAPRYFRTFYSQYVKDELLANRSLTPIVNSNDIIYAEPAEGQPIATAKYVIPLTTNRVPTSASQIKVEEN